MRAVVYLMAFCVVSNVIGAVLQPFGLITAVHAIGAVGSALVLLSCLGEGRVDP